MRSIAIFLIAACAGISALAATNVLNSGVNPSTTAVVTTEQVRAELRAWAPQGIAPGQPVWLGLQITHQAEWHTYWKNPGDSGLATQLTWQLPAGISAGEVAWPLPKKIPIGTLANYGYEGTVLLPVPVTVAQGFNAPELVVRLQASWLVCKKECIPQEGSFVLRLPAQSSIAADGALFQAAFAAAPQTLAAGKSQAVPVASGTFAALTLAGLPSAWQGKTLALYPETPGINEPAAALQQRWQGNTWSADMPLSPLRSESPARLPVVLALEGASANNSVRVELPVLGPWLAPQASSAANQTLSPALEAALRANQAAAASLPANTANTTAPLGLLLALLGALLGGLVLNLMPCVFPVLALKIIGFTQHSQQQCHHSRLTAGMAYSAGVVLSFVALGALLLVLRAAGEQLGWGFQLQSPAVVASLAALFTLIGLNLAGVFEVGNLLPSRLRQLQSKNPAIDAFLSGVLAVAIASPCTAPFMGASLGTAVTLPGIQALAVFAALGIGMALPYLVFSAVPGLVRWLPRPGAWMVTFKQLMAFAMFATTAWLVWVLGQQSGIDGVGALLLILVLLSMVAWALGRLADAPKAASGPRWLAIISIAACAGVFWLAGPFVLKNSPQNTLGDAQSTASGWQTWSPEAVARLERDGQRYFVDFTAAWCITCQVNKKATLSDPAVLAAFQAKNVTLLRADWTRRDPAISVALAQLGRSGVPVYVLAAPGKPPVVLSELLSAAEVQAALALISSP